MGIAKDVAEGLLLKLQAGVDFSIEQAPLVAQEYIRWQIVDGVMGVVFFGALLYGSYRLFRYSMNKVATRRHPFENDWEIGVVVAGIGSVLVFVGVVFSVLQISKACIAPRLVLIEWLGKLLK